MGQSLCIEVLGVDPNGDQLHTLVQEALDVLVVGGGPAGAAASIYTARKGLKTAVIAERFGGQVQETVSIENFISVNRTEGAELARSLESHVKDYDVPVIKQRISAIEPGQPFVVT